jgi:superfamily II DNA/RNA helicase
VQSFGPGRGAKRGPKKQFIDSSRFIKKAQIEETAAYEPQHEFADFDMHPLLKANVTAKGYTVPSEIQDKTISLGLAGRDVVGIANTGTGKTAAFALPVLNRLMRSPGGRALIIAPTRELALQIEAQFQLLAKSSGLSAAILIGGLPIKRQITNLKSEPRVIIGTPGRIKDHLRQRTLTLNNFNTVVLDEVDRMLDMGFINDVRAILSGLPSVHQAFFFSATLSPEISRLIESFASQPVFVDVKKGETTDNVDQDVIHYRGNIQKIDLLHEALISRGVEKILVFGETKRGVERLDKELKDRGFKSASLHGGKNQAQRQRALDSFRDNQVNILVATDVAARGIDIKDITHVINYDTPNSYDDYVHRVGRAGRAGRPGHALTFVEKI